MKTPAPADLQRWTEEVARDPASLAFLPLARAYRRMGRREAALQLCLRGLEHYPQHAEGHALLALLYLERGERARAADEWSIVIRLSSPLRKRYARESPACATIALPSAEKHMPTIVVPMPRHFGSVCERSKTAWFASFTATEMRFSS